MEREDNNHLVRESIMTPLKCMVTRLQFRKLKEGAPIILQVRRARGEPVQRFRAILGDVREEREPALGETADDVVPMHDFNYAMILRDVVRELGNTTTSMVALNRFMRAQLGSQYRGTFPASKKPTLDARRPYCIVNTRDRGTGHWYAMVWTPEGTLVYDPLQENGVDGDVEQADDETNCGARSAAFLLFASKYGTSEASKI